VSEVKVSGKTFATTGALGRLFCDEFAYFELYSRNNVHPRGLGGRVCVIVQVWFAHSDIKF